MINRIVSRTALALALAVVAATTSPSLAREKAPETLDASIKNYNIGLDFVKKGDWDGAIDAFLQSTYFARNGYAPNSYYMLGCAYEAKHEYTKGIEAAKKYLEQATERQARGHNLLAELYMATGHDEDAKNEANAALGGSAYQDPEACHAHFIYAKVLEKDEEWSEAVSHYEMALGDAPWSYTAAWMGLAELLMKEKEWVAALDHFKKMLVSERRLVGLDLVRVHRDMGECLLAKGDHQGALYQWHQALGFDPHDADTHIHLAMMFDSENHISSAISEYKEYIRYSQDALKVAKAKERVAMLEHKLTPAEPEYVVKPSPYQRQRNQMEREPIQPLPETAVQGLPQPKDSGF